MAKRPRSILDSTLNSLSRTNESTLSAKKAEAQVAKLTAGRGHAITVEDASTAPDAAIAQFLQSMRALIDEKGFGAQVEVELRFGKITSCLQEARCRPSQEGVDAAVVLTDEQMKGLGARFAPGVAENEFPWYMKRLEGLLKSDAYAQHVEKQVVHNLAHSKRVIEEINPNTNEREPPEMQVKERLGSIDIFLPQCPYDCRVREHSP
ncbi:hypothetical protein P43SY_008310 [Pythium insidiosum]|uniref:mRNA 5'-phosphatase n=1 Tax=Pythium insidiosum TaxID=114742 RepID=A0AAD5LDF4_PYTIN|nr:hypothetical protein P43SY_008310 [Pythium insidiosum]KAJ0399074.1 hypothetical protein ATCC90586_003039 [Pythium insidiosum]